MNIWECKQCGKKLSDDSRKEFGGVNDSYVLIYQCSGCNTLGYTVTKNTTFINGANVIKTLDLEIHSKEEVDKELKQLGLL